MYTTIALALTLPFAAAMAPAPPVVDTSLHCCYSTTAETRKDATPLCRHDDEIEGQDSKSLSEDTARGVEKTRTKGGNFFHSVTGKDWMVCPPKSMKTGMDAKRKNHLIAGDIMCKVAGARGSVTTCDPHPPQDDGEESGLMESTKPQSLQALGLDEDKAYLKNNMATGLLKRGLRLRSHDETTKLQKFS